jgi:outer membrane protein insertion porin family
VLYHLHGYQDARIGVRVDRVSRSAVEVLFRITEGQPLVLGRLTITGIDSLPASVREIVTRRLPSRAGGPFDQVALDATRDTIVRRLQDNGYPRAQVLRSFEADTIAKTAAATLEVGPGPRAHIGKVNIEVTPRGVSQVAGRSTPSAERPQIAHSDVQRVIRVHEGDLYRARDLEDSKRSLFLTDAFRHVEVQPDSTSIGQRGDTLIDVNVVAAENDLHSARGLVGWATLDCFRAQGDYVDYNFLGGMRRLDLNVRLSKIGVGRPTDFGGDLCSEAQKDQFSETLNYYGGATFRSPLLLRYPFIPTVTLYSERRSEFQAYLRTTPIGGAASFARQTRPTIPMTLGYQLEYGRTEAEDALFCAVFNVCTAADRDRLKRFKRLAVASSSIRWNRSGSLFDPDSGSVLGLDVRHASTLIGSQRDLQFNKVVGEGAWYHSLPGGNRFVARVRLGAVFGAGHAAGIDQFVPPQERLYAGGATTVRGFAQNELGPAVYLTQAQERNNAYDTVRVGKDVYYRANPGTTKNRLVPTGGNRVVVGNIEVRLRSPILPQYAQWAVFADIGEVWNTTSDTTQLNFDELKLTPGVGLRAFTPVGPFRVDIGYNRYKRANGPAFFSLLVPEPRLYCVTPGNTFRVDITKVPAVQEAGTCPAGYQPSVGRGFFQRLQFHLSIGQPF